MEMIKTTGFTELSATEMECIDGGIAWAPVLIWVGKKALGGAITAAAGWGTKKFLDWAF